MKNKRKRIISFLMALAMILSTFNFNLFNPSTVYAQEESNVQATVTVNDSIKGLVNYFNNDYFKEKEGKINLWQQMALKKANVDDNKKWEISTELKDLKEKSLVLMQMDKDPSDYNGEDLIAQIKKQLDENIKGKKAGVDDVRTAIVLDEYNKKYSDKKLIYDTEAFISILLGKQSKSNGSFYFSPINTSYAVNYLAQYKNLNGVKDSIDKAVEFIISKEQMDGGIYGYKFNASQHGEIVINLTKAGINLTEDKWNKGGNTPIDALFKCWNRTKLTEEESGDKLEEFSGKTLYSLCVLKDAGYGNYVLNGVKFDNIKGEKPEEPQKPEEKPEVPEKQKDGSNITSVISGVIDYYNKDHFTKNQGQLVNYEYSAMYKAGADLKKKPWYLVEKYETKYDPTLKYLGGKVNQSLILIDLDKDANNYDGRNLINEIVEIVDKNNDYFAQTDIQAVIAIDNYNGKFKDKKVSYNVEHAVEKILAAQCEDGGFKQRSVSVPINTGYALMALSKHKDIKGVNESISKALAYLHGVQKDDGGLYETTFVTGYHSEVLRGLIAVGENPTSKEWTKASGKNPVDASFTLWKENNSFDGKKGESINNRGWVEATWKALYALVDLREAGYGEYVVYGVKVKGINDGNDGKEEKTCKVNLCIATPENGKYIPYIKPEEVIISDKKHNKGFTALGALQAKTTLFQMTGKMVTSIYGIENKGLNGWMYTVNGVVPDKMADEVSVKAGDKIIWYYSMSSMKGKAPTWEELTGEKPEEKPANATIDPKLVEILPEESFTLNVKCNKGNYFVYTSEIPEIESGNKKIEDGIKFNIPKNTKPGTYKLKNLAVYDIDESSLEKFEGDIREGLLKKMLSEESNKVATLPDVTVVVKEVDGKEEIPSKDYTKEVEDSLNSTSSIILKANISDWNAFALKAAGVDIPDTYLKVIEEKIKNRDKSLFKEGKFKETTDCERTIIGVVAAGGDPRNIGNYNLVEDLCSRDLLNENNIYALAYGIIALDSGKFSLTKNCKFTREDIVNEIVNMQTNGGWGFGTVDSDTTSICLIALSNYKNDEKTKKVINDAVKVLNNIRNDKGEYASSWNKSGSSESISQAIIALTALGIDPTSKEFIKGEKNLMDCLLDYKTKDGGFAHIKDSLDIANPVATQQGLQALAAYKNFKSGNIGSIYNIKRFEDDQNVEEIEIKNLTDVKEFKSGTDAKITVQAINNTKETKNAALIVGLFDKNDRLVNYAAAEQSIDEGKSVTLRVNLKLPKESGYTVKAFVWNGLDDMTPLSNSIEIPVK